MVLCLKAQIAFYKYKYWGNGVDRVGAETCNVVSEAVELLLWVCVQKS